MKGKIRRFFPGANTPGGFYSFFDYIPGAEATKIFCLKGGPGVGKSTLMTFIGQQMLNKGYDIEFHHCSSDVDSIDGVVIPALKISLIDGTAPHLVDPKFPGVVDQIINLGEFWDEDGLKQEKGNILSLTKKYQRMFNIAYSNLQKAHIIYQEWSGYFTEAMDFRAINKIKHYVQQEIFGDLKINFQHAGQIRHFFGSAISPQGTISFLDSVLMNTDYVYLLLGQPGTGKSTFLAKIMCSATEMGLDIEAYHWPMDPHKMEFLVIPALKTAFLSSVDILNIDFNKFYTIEIDLNHFLNKPQIKDFQQEILCCTDDYQAAYQRGIFYIRQAKELHDQLEKHYIPHMDFKAINLKRAQLLDEILEYAAARANPKGYGYNKS